MKDIGDVRAVYCTQQMIDVALLLVGKENRIFLILARPRALFGLLDRYISHM